MDYLSIITGLSYLLIYEDGAVNEKELASVKRMIKAEGFQEADFNKHLMQSSSRDKVILFAECMRNLKRLEYEQQVKIVAWLCVIANADGFMERSEWQLIYKIYHKELNLPLNEIFTVQKDLNRLIWEHPLTIL